MSRSVARKRTSYILVLPDDLMHIIFAKLDMRDKVNAGMVCKQWDQVLRASTPAGRHWVINFNANRAARAASGTLDKDSSAHHSSVAIGRWIAKRATVIKSLTVSAIFLRDPFMAQQIQKFLEGLLPLLAGSLSNRADKLDLAFFYGSPFVTPLLSNPGFLALLCPLVKRLELCNMRVFISPAEFAAVCKLTRLENLSISGSGEDDDADGLDGLTSDISKLVNLQVLNLSTHDRVDAIPESISCLRKLEHLQIEKCPLTDLPLGLGMLPKLTCLWFQNTMMEEGLRLPPDLQGLTSLRVLKLVECYLRDVPSQLSGLSALTSLDLSENWDEFPSSRPTTFSRLTGLAELVMAECCLDNLPVEISWLVYLTRLDLSGNHLTSLPAELSRLRYLRELQLNVNEFATVPVSVLSGLTMLKTIDLSQQHKPRYRFPSGDPAFEIPTPLLPIVHPGLVKLDLRQRKPWDSVSLFHMGDALAAVADRSPPLTLLL